MPRKRLVVIGRAGRPFGVRGQFRVIPFTENSDAFKRSAVLLLDDRPFKVESIRAHKGALVIALEGIKNPELAGEYTGCLVKTDSENLPPKEEDEYYWFELIGMRVITVDGSELGSISWITETGANDVLHVDGDRGEILLPMIDDVVIEIDDDRGTMIVDPLEGLIPDG
jgi:16S rRNA processing protein RimM